MSVSDLKRELRIVEGLIDALNPDVNFAEDLVCLEMNRKALAMALSIERGRRRKISRLGRVGACRGLDATRGTAVAKT